ncbi:vitamin K-dependent protein S isoform X2 [Pristis pectinata]|uniref:vitamin K-dependent protein S isoform X2 n=1 Tax=Pristis pectinata TaxID=685728 RepID=UPI00223D2AEF|nr:vitamin K-dependent protein S isoform X2 [Pristis pectinata]
MSRSGSVCGGRNSPGIPAAPPLDAGLHPKTVPLPPQTLLDPLSPSGRLVSLGICTGAARTFPALRLYFEFPGSAPAPGARLLRQNRGRDGFRPWKVPHPLPLSGLPVRGVGELRVYCPRKPAAVLTQRGASQFLGRARRANVIFEERRQGSLERECVEEYCNKEEAREIFENNLETEYFYPKYLDCLSRHRSHTPSMIYPSQQLSGNLKNCIREIPDQCSPSLCHREGSIRCVDGKAAYNCVCKEGWQGERCEKDIDECQFEERVCSHSCRNFPGSYRCFCQDGFYMSSDKKTCVDRNECFWNPNICGKASCKNMPGSYECECNEGYRFNFTKAECEDIDECAEGNCTHKCLNYPGGFTCFCDGKKGEKLSADRQTCEAIPICVALQTVRKPDLLNMGELFAGIPVVYLRFKSPTDSRFTAEFDLRTFDLEGVIFYAETQENAAWLMLAVRKGKMEVQFKNDHIHRVKISGGPQINDGTWHTISVEENESSVVVKVAHEAVIKINSPGRIFADNTTTEMKISIAGLPRQVHPITPHVNPRLDGCMRRWTWMNQGSAGIQEVIQNIKTKQCFQSVERGSYFPGRGYALLPLNYSTVENGVSGWKVELKLQLRPSKDTGVVFALVSGKAVPLSLAVTDAYCPETKQHLILAIDNEIVSRTESLYLCDGEHHSAHLTITPQDILLEVDQTVYRSHLNSSALREQLGVLDQAMREPLNTTLGGVPEVPVTAAPITASFTGCLQTQINQKQIDFDEATEKHNEIQSHSCPLVQRGT